MLSIRWFVFSVSSTTYFLGKKKCTKGSWRQAHLLFSMFTPHSMISSYATGWKSFYIVFIAFFFYSFKNIQQKKHQEAATHQPHICHSCWKLILQAQNCGHSSEDNINSHNVQLSVGSINQFSFPGCHIPMFCHTPPHRSAVVLKNQSNCSKEISLVPKSYLRSYLLE